MEKQKSNKVKNELYYEILKNDICEKLDLKGFNKLLLPYNSKYSLCLFIPEQNKQSLFPIYFEEMLKIIPDSLIIFDNNFNAVSTNINDKNFLEKAQIQVKSVGEKHIEKLLLSEHIITKFSYKKENYQIMLTPLTTQKNLGFLCVISQIKQKNIFESKFMQKMVSSILSAKDTKDLFLITKGLKEVLKTENLFLFQDVKGYLYPLYHFKENIILPEHIKESLEKKEMLILNKKIFGIKPLENQLKKHIVIFRFTYFKKKHFVIIGSSNKEIDEKIENQKWLLKLFFIMFVQLKRNEQQENLFDDYELPVILVNKQTMNIVYSNKSFKKYFGKDILFLNTILPIESNIKILKKLDSNFEPFSDYLEVITADNFKTIVKATIIPEINSDSRNLFAIIFKTQKHEIKIKTDAEQKEKKGVIQLEAIPVILEKYTSLFSKTMNIEKAINFFLKDFSRHFKADLCFVSKIDLTKKIIYPINHYNKNNLNWEVLLKNLSKQREIFKKHKKTIIELQNINNLTTLLIININTGKDSKYIWGIGFEKFRYISTEEKLFISSAGNLLSITLKRKNEKKILINTEKEIKQLEKLNNKIITTISHEIKSPLTSILGLCDIMTNKINKKDIEPIISIKKNALKLLDLLETILETNKIKEQGTELIRKESINTNEFIESIKSFVRGINKNPNVVFRLQTKNIKPFFIHDANIIYRIIINLLDNSFRHTNRGVVTLSIDFLENFLIIEIKDTGEGISKENLKNVFIPFFQEHSKNKKKNGQNVGLGLYIVKQLCDIIGGDIYLKSEKGIGTYFKITIPLKGEK